MLKKSVLLASLLLGAALLPYGCKKSQATAKSETRSTTKTEAASSASVDPQKQMVISLVEKRLNSDTELVKCTDIVNQTAVATNRYTAKAIVFKTKMYEPFRTSKFYVQIYYEFIGDSVEMEFRKNSKSRINEYTGGVYVDRWIDFNGLEMTDKDQAYVIQLQAEARRIVAERARIEAEKARIEAEKRAEAERAAAERRRIAAKKYLASIMDTMVQCPAGSFMMGSPADESGRGSDEVQHRVTLTKPFWIGKYEVTQSQYEAVMGNNPSYFKGSDRPVETVSWDEAMAFCEKLNHLTEGKRPAGYKFSLPTEAQWEYACRAGTTGAYAGNLDSMGWYYGNSGDTHPVGQKRPNAWGIYDMHGNVCEWCLDWYGAYHGDATDPVGPASGSVRVNRGGYWNDYARFCRSALRIYLDPGVRFNVLGFRVALVPVQ